MKKSIKFFAIFVFVLLVTASICACTKISDSEKKVVGRYNLTSISGLKNDTDNTDITVDFFEENYIVLLNDKSFKIYNKQNGVEYQKSGKWSFSGETLSLKMSGMFSKNEKHTLKDNVITLSGEINGQAVTMTFALAS